MNDTVIPDVQMNVSDVVENTEVSVESVQDQPSAQSELTPEEYPETEEAQVEESAAEFKEESLADKTLAEIITFFQNLADSVDAMSRSKEAEAIKSAFYKKLNKEKTEENPLEAIEEGFKSLYAGFKEKRAEYNRAQEAAREENLTKKCAVIDDLKNLVEKQEDVSATFPAFREIQNRWREIGPVPAHSFRDVNDRYQFYVEKFYDMVKINRDLRDLDFKKNLEAKQAFCEAAEKLSENENVIAAFRELQKLHEQWKEFGPVAKEYRDEIWDRFKAATAVINKKYQAYFESMKEKQGENLDAKSKLCDKLDEIVAKAEEGITSSKVWNSLSKDIEDIQKEWKTIGFASKKENQKIYDRFRASCDKFFAMKRDFYTGYKDSMKENLEKKNILIEKAEELKNSTEWKKTTEAFIELQKQWKEIGAVPREKSNQLWKKFRAACDEFFEERDKQAKPENDFYGNLKAKKAILEEIAAFVVSDDAESMQSAMEDFQTRWNAIGFVPFKEKDNIAQAFKEAMQAKFPDFGHRPQRGQSRFQSAKAPKSAKDILIQKYNSLQQDIQNFENNIGFFSMSKKAEALKAQMQEKLDEAKQELKELEEKIRNAEKDAE